MKKTLAAALTTAFVVGMSSSALAAANPFSDVPAGHWAYNSVSKLAAEGVIEGYGDGTYRGDRNITRYEMAQMVAKAMAKNPTGANKAELDRLAAEFRDELDALGVRVAELEKYADKVVWQGKIEYTYEQTKTDPENTGKKTKDTANGYIFRLEPKAYVNDHWTVNARLDAYGDMKKDETTNFELKRAWAEGDYDKLNLKIGRFEFYPEGEAGLMWDTEISGGSITYGSKWKFNVTGGRVAADVVGSGIYGENETEDDPATVVGLRVDYNQGNKGFFGGAGFCFGLRLSFCGETRFFGGLCLCLSFGGEASIFSGTSFGFCSCLSFCLCFRGGFLLGGYAGSFFCLGFCLSFGCKSGFFSSLGFGFGLSAGFRFGFGFCFGGSGGLCAGGVFRFAAGLDLGALAGLLFGAGLFG
ncbi:MAG: S-layer homology domain-containing protein, partial [Selenomonadaceae bacterium]|nr:S-layer homology domain-containing protein [Selenomonadaceae bacterium]